MSTGKKTQRSAATDKQRKTGVSKGANSQVKRKRVEQRTEEEELNLLPAFVDHTRSVINNLKRFGWDLLGTFLALLAMLTLLGLLGLSR